MVAAVAAIACSIIARTGPDRASLGSPAAAAVQAGQRYRAVHAAGDRPAVMR